MKRLLVGAVLLLCLWSSLIGAARRAPAGPVGQRGRDEPQEPPAQQNQAQAVQDSDIRFQRFTQEQGLSVSVVYDIAQDRQGFLWFATEDGLNRYDGRNFVVFRHDPGNTNSLSYNWLNTLLVDRAGDLWIGAAGGGLNRYDPLSGQFTRYRHDPNDPASLSGDNVTCLFEDSEGNLWVGGDGGVDRMNRASGRFERLRADPDAPDLLQAPVSSLRRDSLGRLWIGTSKGLIQYDPLSGEYLTYQHQPENPRSLSYNFVSDILEDRSGQIWVATRGGGLNLLDPLNGIFQHIENDPTNPNSLGSNITFNIFEDSQGILWIGAWGGGLTRYDPQQHRFTRFVNQPDNPHSLGGNYIWQVFEDASGALWVATWGAGLSQFDRASEQFLHYHKRADDANSLSSDMIWSILPQGDRLWVGTQAGLDVIDRAAGGVKHYSVDLEHPDGLKDAVITALHADRLGRVWVGSARGGLYRIDPESESFTRYAHDPLVPDSLASDGINAIREDAAGQLWLATKNGLDRLDPSSGRFVHFTADAHDPQTLSSNIIFALHIDRSGMIWAGTEEGLNRLDPRQGQVTRYLHTPGNSNSLSENRVTSLAEDSQGVLWVGTAGGGLNRFDPAGGEWRIYRERNGLPNDTVYAIVEDQHGQLWISTNHGLARFDPQQERFKTYDVQDGLQSNEFNANAYARSAQGELFFGGINGVTAFYPDNIRSNPYVPPVALVALTQSGQALALDNTLAGTQQVRLNWPNNFFEFEFAALSYVQSNQNRFAYRLEGFDRAWIDSGGNPFGRYTNLPGGTYTLRLKAANNDGIWNEGGARLTITVVPPVWQTWWFRSGLALLVLFVGLGGYRLRVRSIEAQNRRLIRQVQERTREIERRHQELEALYRADEALYRNLHLDQVLAALVDSALDLLQADKGSLLVWDEAHKRLMPRVTRGFHPDTVAKMVFTSGEGVVGIVAATGEPVLVPDTSCDERVTRSVVEPEGIRSFMQVPIKVDGEVFGVFSADFLRLHTFRQENLHQLMSLAQRAGLAIQNAQLYEQTQTQAVVEERNRLARDLHDAVTQTLFSASLLAEAVPAAWEADPEQGRQLLAELRQLSRGALAEMRSLLMELRPSALAEADLGDLLRQLGEAAAGREGIPVTVQLDGRCDLPPDVHIALYRIAQEALNNALKHARAGQITVHLRRVDGSDGEARPAVALTVRDDGRGFDPERVIVPNHFGMGIMRERAQAVGATLTVESQPGMGAQITVLWEAA